MSEMTAEQRRQQLEQELAQVRQEEEREAEERRRQAQAEREASLDPAMRAQKEEIERRADEQLEKQWPPSWNPTKPGSDHPKKLVGLVTRIDPRVGPSKTYGTYSAVIEIRTTEGDEWTVWANESGVLYGQLLRLRIQPGELVAILYRGKKASEQNPGQSYQDYRFVRVEDDDVPPAPVDYDALQRSRETPALPTAEGAAGAGAQPDDDIPF